MPETTTVKAYLYFSRERENEVEDVLNNNSADGYRLIPETWRSFEFMDEICFEFVMEADVDYND